MQSGGLAVAVADSDGHRPGRIHRAGDRAVPGRAPGTTIPATTRWGAEPVLAHLRRVGVVPAPGAPAPVGAVEVLLARFAGYLAGRAGAERPGGARVLALGRPFRRGQAVAGGQDGVRGHVGAGEVAAFLTAQLPLMSRKSAQMTACALRSFLRFLHAAAMTEIGAGRRGPGGGAPETVRAAPAADRDAGPAAAGRLRPARLRWAAATSR